MPPKGEKVKRATRKKISETQKKRFLREAATSPLNAPTHKRCNRCGKRKAVTDFHTDRRKLKSGLVAVYPASRCAECHAKDCKERRDRQMKEGINIKAIWRKYHAEEDREKSRRRGREYAASKRRKMGIPVRGCGPYKRESEADRRLPIVPIAELLKAEIDKHGMDAVASFTSVDERRLRGIREQEYSTIKSSTVDRILAGLGCPEKLQELYPIEEPEKLVGWHYLDPKGLLPPPEAL